MHATLVVTNGDDAGRRIPVPSGALVRVGRLAPAEALIPGDPMLSNLHFEVECGADGTAVKDLGSRFGTLLNGAKIARAAVRTGDEIKAGRTTFAVELLGDTEVLPALTAEAPVPKALAAPAPAPAAGPEPAKLTALLKGLPGRLYAILDAAREPSVVARMTDAKAEFASLYDGEQGKEIEEFGPWLVGLQPGHPLLEELATDGWGRSWGVYLSCDLPLGEVRRHLRKFLMAKMPDGRQVYFRFYDPRVLRTYLPTCTPDELATFFGPIRRIVAESPDPTEAMNFGVSFSDWKKANLAAG